MELRSDSALKNFAELLDYALKNTDDNYLNLRIYAPEELDARKARLGLAIAELGKSGVPRGTEI